MAEEKTNEDARPDNAENSADSSENQSLLNKEVIEQEDTEENVEELEVAHLEKDVPEVAKQKKEERPEDVPEQFWNEKEGKIEVEKLTKAYNELRNKMSTGSHKPPKDGKYDLSFMEGLEEDDPIMDKFIGIAKDHNFSQGLVEDLTKFYLESNGVIENEIKYKRDEEIGKLGKNGSNIISNLDNWVRGLRTSNVLTPEETEAFANSMTNALAISALNKIRRSYGEPTIPNVNVMEGNRITLEDLRSQVADERYGKDPVFTKKVEDGFYELHGEKP